MALISLPTRINPRAHSRPRWLCLNRGVRVGSCANFDHSSIHRFWAVEKSPRHKQTAGIAGLCDGVAIQIGDQNHHAQDVGKAILNELDAIQGKQLLQAGRVPRCEVCPLLGMTGTVALWLCSQASICCFGKRHWFPTLMPGIRPLSPSDKWLCDRPGGFPEVVWW